MHRPAHVEPAADPRADGCMGAPASTGPAAGAALSQLAADVLAAARRT